MDEEHYSDLTYLNQYVKRLEKERRETGKELAALRAENAELRARLEAQGQTPGRTIRYLDSDGKVFEEPDEPVAGTA